MISKKRFFSYAKFAFSIEKATIMNWKLSKYTVFLIKLCGHLSELGPLTKARIC
jgi:hypothetical protein